MTKNRENTRSRMRSKINTSIVAGGLIGTLGLFIAKCVGLFYSIPLSSILGNDNLMSCYGSAYRIYTYTLNIFTAGFPFAISTLVAKYSALDDNRSLVKIHSLSKTFLKVSGFIGMLILVMISGWIAPALVADSAYIPIMTFAMRILSLSIFFVPYLSAYRGFWQGRKEMGEYAFTQTFEQIFRVGFLLSAAYIIVYALHMDRKYALYAAVLSTSVAAIAAIIQIYFFDKSNFREIQESANAQPYKGRKKKDLFKELIVLAIPYMLTAVIGYSDDMFNSFLLPVSLKLHGYNSADVAVILSAFNYVGSKMASIPQVLSPGFAAAMIPHVTEALTDHDDERISKIVTECVAIVIFVGSFLSVVIALYADDIYHVLFYTNNPQLAASVLRWIAIEAFMGTISPVTSSLMIALRMRKEVLRNLVLSAVIKGITMLPLIYLFGYRGAVYSSILGHICVFGGNLYLIAKHYKLDIRLFIVSALKIAAALLCTSLVCIGLKKIGITGVDGSKASALVKLLINGLFTMIAYFGFSELLKIPDNLFHRNILAVITSRLKRS